MIATSPATAPEAAPSIDGLPCTTCSTSAQLTAAAAVATKVLMKATAVTPLASRLEPALKPNQPTHSSEAPIIVMVSECGGIGSLAVADALADHQAADQPGDAGIDVDDGAAGEVERALAEEIAGMSVGASGE